jgi:predicted XRE-type DNA-binding protein
MPNIRIYALKSWKDMICVKRFYSQKYSPEDAAKMKLRSVFMMAISDYVKNSGETQAIVAERLGISQPRLSDLLKGKISKFSLDTLVTLAIKAGLSIDLNVKESNHADCFA